MINKQSKNSGSQYQKKIKRKERFSEWTTNSLVKTQLTSHPE